MNDYLIIIQARMNSTRLPGKMAMLVDDVDTLLEKIIKRVKLVSFNESIVVATSVESSDDIIEQISHANDVNCYRGDQYDVLGRFISAANKYNAKDIIRICGDNPFLHLNDLKRLIHYNTEADYVSFVVNGQPSIRTHYGFWAEKVKLEKLKHLHDIGNYMDREHVTYSLHSADWSNKAEMLIPSTELINLITQFESLRLTIDSIVDLQNVKELYACLKGVDVLDEIDQLRVILERKDHIYESMFNEKLKYIK